MKRLLAFALAFASSAVAALEVNTATQAQLEALPGLGVASTERLLAERERAPFRDWADLMRRMKGLKRASAAKLSAAGLTVGGVAYAAESAASGPR